MKGHNVSHANNKTKEGFTQFKKSRFTVILKKFKINCNNAGVRSVDKKGSFDDFLNL